jgi:hypothetical protein
MNQHYILSQILRYEAGELTPEQTTELFQSLVDTGIVWQLQGHYGRTAARMIFDGKIAVGKRGSN